MLEEVSGLLIDLERLVIIEQVKVEQFGHAVSVLQTDTWPSTVDVT